MKRLIVLIALVVLVAFGLAKLVVLVSAHQVLSQIKAQLVPYGSLNHGVIDTFLFEGKMTVNSITFKDFRYKQDIDATKATLDFGGGLSLLTGLVSIGSDDYSSLESIYFESFSLDLPNQTLYEQLSEGRDFNVQGWLGWLSCDGSKAPVVSDINALGVDSFSSDVYLTLTPGNSKLELDINKLGRVLVFSNALEFLNGEQSLKIDTLQYVENGYFKRLENVCNIQGEPQQDGRTALANQMVKGWSQSLSQKGFRFETEALDMFRQYIIQGGVIEFSFDSNQDSESKEQDQYGWISDEATARYSVAVNDSDPTLLGLENYVAAPAPVRSNNNIPKVEPGYVESDTALVEELLNKRIQVKLLNEKQYEGVLTDVTEHQVVIVPLDGDGNFAYTLKRVELALVEVWIE